MKTLLQGKRYTPSWETDVSQSIKREKKRLRDEELQREANRAEIEVKVSQIKKKA